MLGADLRSREGCKPLFISHFLDKDQNVLGAVLRSREGCKLLFISVGNRIDLDTAVQRTCTTGYRIPELTRLAHRLVNAIRKKARA